MTRWKAICVIAWLLVFAAIFGCGKSSNGPASTPASAAPVLDSAVPGTVLRIHWLGRNAIAADRNATNVLKLWDLPESVRLQSQTLEKLSAAPWRFLLGQTNPASANLVRPLLDDVVAQECYLEVRKADAAGEMVLSVRLNADHADLWGSKLATLMQALGATPASRNPAGWSLSNNNRSNYIEFTRAGNWSLLSMSQSHNALLDETIVRINRQHTPVVDWSVNAFLEGFVDLARLGNASRSNMLSQISFTLKFDDNSVMTTGELQLSHGLRSPLPPWKIPTNLIPENAIGITAARGFAPWLESSKVWKDLNAGPPPDQCFSWAMRGAPMQTYLVMPMQDASNAAARIAEFALRRQGPPWLANALSGFHKSKTSNGLSWHGFPYFTPFLRSESRDGQNLLVSGFLEADLPPSAPPAGFVEGILSKTNLVYYDRELTGYRLDQWIQLGQVLRFICGASQLPGKSASLEWLQAIGSQLRADGTEITEVGPGSLSFTRKSDLGFSAIELHLLADWLESPEFPLGTHSSLVRSSESQGL